MKKLISLLLVAIIAVGICGCSSAETQTATIQRDDIDGYEYANFDTYNSYAEDNGLKETKVYIKGVVKSAFDFADSCNMSVVSEDGGRWLVSFVDTEYNEKAEDLFDEKEIVCFGKYGGFSDVVLMPVIYIDKIEVNGETYTASDIEEQVTEEYTTVEPTTIKPTEKATEKPTEEPKSVISIGKLNALKSAESYLDVSAFSYQGLIEQLAYEKYSNVEAVYAADNCGADWYEQAAKCAESYLDVSSFSKDSLIEQLEYEGFTHDQAVYGVEQNGY